MDNNLPHRPPLIFWIFVIVLIIALALGGVYWYLSKTGKLVNLFKGPTNTWTPTATPAPIGTGPQIYRISGGVQGLPTISEVLVTPIDPKKGQKQTIKIKANNGTPIKEVAAILKVDNNKEIEHILKLSGGTITNGEWSGSWNTDFTYEKTYRITVRAKNENNLGNIHTITLR